MHIQDGFNNQRLIAIPEKLIKTGTYVTNIGYFPNAKYHYMRRTKGCKEHIIILCIAGKGFVSHDGQKKAITSDTLTIIPKDIPHQYGADNDAPWDIYWVHFHTDREFPYETITSVCLSKEQSNTYVDIFYNMLHSLIDNIDTDSLALNTAALEYMLSLLTRQHRPAKLHPQIVIDTKNYVLSHLDEPLSIKKLVDAAECSKSYLHYTFKSTFGESPISYLTRIKMDIAANYLRITKMSVKQIAFTLGYKDPYYFSRLFKKLHRFSPKQFRENNTNV